MAWQEGYRASETPIGLQIAAGVFAQFRRAFPAPHGVPCCRGGKTPPKKPQVNGYEMGCVSPIGPRPDRFPRPSTCGFAASPSSGLPGLDRKSTSILTMVSKLYQLEKCNTLAHFRYGGGFGVDVRQGSYPPDVNGSRLVRTAEFFLG